MKRAIFFAVAAALVMAGGAEAQRTVLPADSLLRLFSVDSAAVDPAFESVGDVSRLSCGARAGMDDGHCVAELETGAGSVCRAVAILTAYRALVRRRDEVTQVLLRCTGRSVRAGVHVGSGDRAFFRVQELDRDERVETSYMVPMAQVVREREPERPRRDSTPQRPRPPQRPRRTPPSS